MPENETIHEIIESAKENSKKKEKKEIIDLNGHEIDEVILKELEN